MKKKIREYDEASNKGNGREGRAFSGKDGAGNYLTASPSRKVAFYGVFLALALVASYIERMLPIQTGIPGVKPGLANIVTMILLYTVGVRAAVTVSALRIILSGLMFGSGWSVVYSAAGAALSMLAMVLVRKTGLFSSVGVSVVGGVSHNLGQLLVAAAVVSTARLIWYLPVLIVSGIGAGVLVGLIAGLMTGRLAPLIRQMLPVLLLPALILILPGCRADIGRDREAGQVKSYRLTDFVMNTVLQATVYGSRDVTGQIKPLLSDLEKDRLSYREPNSQTAKINEAGLQGRAYRADGEFADLTEQSLQLAEDSEGAFDPSIGALTRLWNIEGENPSVPSGGDLKEALKHIGYRNVRIKYTDGKDEERDQGKEKGSEDLTAGPDRDKAEAGKYVTEERGEEKAKVSEAAEIRLENQCSLDLGAVGKGIACDEVRRYLDREPAGTVKGAVVSVGGSILTYGTKPDGSPWTVAIRDPRADEGEVMGVISTDRNAVISTSGDYEKYFEEKGKRYHHILDPRTGYPAQSGLMSVTVVSENGLLSDGLSTACFVLGKEKGLKLLEKYEAEGIFIDTDKNVTVTEGIRDCFEICNDDYHWH